MSTLYGNGERVRVRTVTSEMDAITAAPPEYRPPKSDAQRGSWYAPVVGRPLERLYRILGRVK